MPVDLALSTNTPAAAFELRQLQPLGDHRHLAAFLVVRSGAFAAAMPFVCTRVALGVFATELEAVTGTQSGTATLSSREGGGTIRFAATDDARLRITGELGDREDDQLLRFAFSAEWQGVPALTEGIRRALDTDAYAAG